MSASTEVKKNYYKIDSTSSHQPSSSPSSPLPVTASFLPTMSDYMISLPSTSSDAPSTTSSSSSQRTNSLAVTSLPKTFFHPVVLTVLKSHFQSYGEINQWVPLPGFGRIIIVYTEEEHAELAKTECDPIILRGTSDMYVLFR